MNWTAPIWDSYSWKRCSHLQISIWSNRPLRIPVCCISGRIYGGRLHFSVLSVRGEVYPTVCFLPKYNLRHVLQHCFVFDWTSSNISPVANHHWATPPDSQCSPWSQHRLSNCKDRSPGWRCVFLPRFIPILVGRFNVGQQCPWGLLWRNRWRRCNWSYNGLEGGVICARLINVIRLFYYGKLRKVIISMSVVSSSCALTGSHSFSSRWTLKKNMQIENKSHRSMIDISV